MPDEHLASKRLLIDPERRDQAEHLAAAAAAGALRGLIGMLNTVIKDLEQATLLPDVDPLRPLRLGICTAVHDAVLLRQPDGVVRNRVNELLMLIRSVTRRTAASCATTEEYVLHLDSRLDALAQIYGAVSCDAQAGLNVASLVTDALLAYGAHEGDQVDICGPDVDLTDWAGILVGLAVHELAMNAIKHGALSVDGRIAVRWRLMTGYGTVLRFEWLETGLVLPDQSSRRTGYGTELIEQILPRETGAEVSFQLARHGLHCVIDLPIVAGQWRARPA